MHTGNWEKQNVMVIFLQHMLERFDVDQTISTNDEFRKALQQCCNAKHSLARSKGYTPEILVLGKSQCLPGSVCEDVPKASHFLYESDTPEGLAFRKHLEYRECARRAFAQADNSEKLRRAFLRRQRPHRGRHLGGSFVMFWRPGKGEYRGQWHGPARVIIQESDHVVWISFSSRVYRVALNTFEVCPCMKPNKAWNNYPPPEWTFLTKIMVG